MVKMCERVKAQWSTEFVKLILSTVKSATPLAFASRTHGILLRTISDCVIRERSLKKLGRNAVFTPDVEKQLHQRIVRLKHVGFLLI
jgi:hypothetical protein